MSAISNTRLATLFGVPLPIVQAPMAGATTPEMAIGVARAGGLGSLPCAQYTLEQARSALYTFRGAIEAPVNLNFFCHVPPSPDPAGALAWRATLARYYVEAGLDPAQTPPDAGRAPFDEGFCALVEAMRPEVVSFHFGLPDQRFLDRVKAAGCKVLSSATTVAEARWLQSRGADAIIATGAEAGGHRATFLPQFGDHLIHRLDMAAQPGLFALLPQVVDAVSVPVIAAGGVADPRGVAAAAALGASGVQVGTAYLFTPEANIPAAHRAGLDRARDDNTMLTDVFTGRPARGVVNRLMLEIGPIAEQAPPFPTAGGALAPLRQEGKSLDFVNAWAGQSARLAPRHLSAYDLTLWLAGRSEAPGSA